MNVKPVDSSYQRELEGFMLREIQSRYEDWNPMGWPEAARELGLSTVWQKAQPDGVWKDAGGHYIIVEYLVHLGLLKAGQRRKLASVCLDKKRMPIALI